MNTNSMFGRGLVAMLVAVPAAGVAVAQKPKDIPGAKLVGKIPAEVYVEPQMLQTGAGPRLVVTAHSSKPLDRFPDELHPGVLPEVVTILWDVAANKEVARFSTAKKENGPFSGGVPADFSPDGKKIAYFVQNPNAKPRDIGVIGYEHLIKIYDVATRKSDEQPARYTGSMDHLRALPDGNLLIIRTRVAGPTQQDTTCFVQEPGKPTARNSFRLGRARDPKDLLAQFAGPEKFSAPELSADGSSMAVSSDDSVTIYDLKSGKVTYQSPTKARKPDDLLNSSFFRTTLAFGPLKQEEKLLVIDHVSTLAKAHVLARVFDVKAKKEICRATVFEKAAAPGKLPEPFRLVAHPYFNSKGEARVLLEGKVYDVAAGKVVNEFDPGKGTSVSRDGQFMARCVPSAADMKKMNIEIWEMDAEALAK
jgi:hypothetical protein